jgi:hypothetical protein
MGNTVAKKRAGQEDVDSDYRRKHISKRSDYSSPQDSVALSSQGRAGNLQAGGPAALKPHECQAGR